MDDGKFNALLEPTKKDRTVHVRVTADEHAAIEKAAEDAGMTVSSFFRSLLLEGAGVRPMLTGDDRLVMAALLEDMRMIGINLNQTRFPAVLADRATSLRLVTGRVHDRDAMLAALLAQIGRRYAPWLTDGFRPLRSDWLAHARLPGQIVRLPDGTLGAGEDVRDDGVLLARAADGRLVPVVSGSSVEEVTAHAAGR